MLNPFGRDNEPSSYFQLQKRLLIGLKSAAVDDRVFEMVKAEYDKALQAENVVLARGEKRRLMADVLKAIFDEVTQRLIRSEA
jgi:hypothetical protein